MTEELDLHRGDRKCSGEHECLPQPVDGGVLGSQFVEIDEPHQVVGFYCRHNLGINLGRFLMEAIGTIG